MNPIYKTGPECLIVVFNLQFSEAEERLHRQQIAWLGSARIDRLTADTVVLNIQPGAATRLAA
jgi:hypothetical protein